MRIRREGDISGMPVAKQHESDHGLTPELIGIVLAVLVLGALVGILITLGA